MPNLMEEVFEQIDTRHARLQVIPEEKASSPLVGSAIQGNPLADVLGDEGMHQAKSQLQHYRGRPYAPAKLKAQRIAGQPLHVASKAKSKGKREAGTKSVMDVLRNMGGVKQEAERVRVMLQFLPEAIRMAPDGWTINDEHPILVAVRDPNPTMGEGKLAENTVLSLEITGKAFQHIQQLSAPDSEGRKYRIWYYPPSWVSPIHTPDLFSAWKVRASGGSSYIEIPGSNMAYFHYSDPADPLGALGPLQAMAADVVADEAISETQRNAFINACWPSLMFILGKHPGMKTVGGLGSGGDAGRPLLTAEQRREMTIWIKQMYRGWKKAGEPMIIDGMFEDVKPVSTSIREMDFLKSAGLKESQINAGFTVNPISMGKAESANRASASMSEDHLCTPAGELVLTGRGMIPIEEVKVGDAVWTHRGRWREVLECMANQYDGDLVEIQGATPSWPTRCTPSHPWLIRSKGGDVDWRRAEDIGDGNVVCLPRVQDDGSAPAIKTEPFGEGKARVKVGRVHLHNATASLPEEITITKSCAWAMGYYLANGCRDKSNCRWYCHTDDVEYVRSKLDSFMGEIGLSKTEWISRPNTLASQMRVGSSILANILQWYCGKLAAGKKIAPEIMEWPRELKKSFVGGYLYGDGSIQERQISFRTVSRSLAIGMRYLLASMGIPCGLSHTKSKGARTFPNGITSMQAAYYGGRISGQCSVEVADWMGLSVREKKGDSVGNIRYFATDDHCCFPIASVKRVPYTGWVYNLSVNEDNSYCTSLGATHNCGNALNPIVRLYNSVITKKYAQAMAPGENIMVWMEPCKPTDREMDILEKKVRLAAGVRFFNEWRREQGDEDVPGMEDVIVTAQGLMTKEMVLSGQGSQQGNLNQTPAGVPNDPVNAQTGKSPGALLSKKVRTIVLDDYGDPKSVIDEEFST